MTRQKKLAGILDTSLATPKKLPCERFPNNRSAVYFVAGRGPKGVAARRPTVGEENELLGSGGKEDRRKGVRQPTSASRRPNGRRRRK